jgi:outer membrane protein insertion porin family
VPNPVPIDTGFNPRAAIGVSVLWDAPIGPLRFNFSRALKKESYDRERNFDLTISTQF